MRRGSKTLIGAVAVLLLVVGPVGCGGGETGSSASETFSPKQHDDSGGGSQQFIVKGGDNVVQEFGSEADSSEFDEAAAAMHNFFDARAEGNEMACTYVSQRVIDSLKELAISKHERFDCAMDLKTETVSTVMRALPAEAAQADVASLRVEGDEGVLIYRGAHNIVRMIPMSRFGGSWKVASLSPISLHL